MTKETPTGPDDIVILTECGVDIGYGHLMRCQSLARAFSNRGFKVRLVVAGEVPAGLLDPFTCAFEWRHDAAAIPPFQDARLVLVDSHVADLRCISLIEATVRNVAFIDDFPYRDYRRGVVIDFTVGAESYAYLPPVRRDGVTYLLGCQYSPLRSPFEQLTPRRFEGPVKSLLLTFGGSDPRQLTRPVLEHLGVSLPGIERRVILGPGVSPTARHEVKRLDGLTVLEDVDAPTMQRLMAEACICICGGGQTLYELASIGTPPVIIKLVDNQSHDIREFCARGFGRYIGDWDKPDLLPALVSAVEQLNDPTERARLSAAGRACVDGRGAQRLADAILAGVLA
ncbi:MAG: hypothetical protein EXR76_13060 [Myxococcales bacterium]|nr:hypothetical protein [Myxococcales bacterium]